MTAPTRCPVCEADLIPASWSALATHLVERADASEDRHVMWLNRNITKHRVGVRELARLLELADRGERPADQERVRR